ncbi:MAG: T9SS type A sorting domain-containing protein [Prevotellaceae bacterium]|nr:T9SS type A sorting domain-containing protein [Prevotellaceae bacterium]
MAYPNPVQSGSQLNIKIFSDSNIELNNGTIEVYDLKGVRLSSTKVQGFITPISIKSTPGVYIVRLRSDDLVEDMKIIVQ